MSLVLLATAKQHLNVTTDDDDEIIQAKIDAAEAHIETIVGGTLYNWVTPDVREAILQLTGHFYENREATLVGVSAEEIPFGVWQLLAAYREYVF